MHAIARCDVAATVIRTREHFRSLNIRMSKSRRSRSQSRSGRSRSRSRSLVRIPIDKETQISGYHLSASELSRHRAINANMPRLGKNTLIRRLNALSIVHRNKNPRYSARARADMVYVQEK